MKRQPPITRPTSPSAAPPRHAVVLAKAGPPSDSPFPIRTSFPRIPRISRFPPHPAGPYTRRNPLSKFHFLSTDVHGCPPMSTDVHRNPAHSSPPNGANPRKISFQLHFVALCCTLLHSNPPIRQNSILGSRKSFPLFSSAQSNPFFPASHSPPVISTKTA